MNKYLTYAEIESIIGKVSPSEHFSIMSQDSYNESKIAEVINQTQKSQELLHCAINLATVGYGNRKFGNFRLNNQIISIAQVFKDCAVSYNNPAGALLKEDELTPQRLCRFYRHHIKTYIEEHKIQTYLYRKYSKKDSRFFAICFRGAEYLDNLSSDEEEFLLNTYSVLDNSLNLNTVARFNRVRQAKKGLQFQL